ncbi:MAG: hypothetical protein EB078_11280 [Proteobacteria bacterium]|nr:hypothetical protein [Pseudomonadota bacterium]
MIQTLPYQLLNCKLCQLFETQTKTLKEKLMKALLNILVTLGLIAVPALADHPEKAMDKVEKAAEATTETVKEGAAAVEQTAAKTAKTWKKGAKKAMKKAEEKVDAAKDAVKEHMGTTTETAPVAPPAGH